MTICIKKSVILEDLLKLTKYLPKMSEISPKMSGILDTRILPFRSSGSPFRDFNLQPLSQRHSDTVLSICLFRIRSSLLVGSEVAELVMIES